MLHLLHIISFYMVSLMLALLPASHLDILPTQRLDELRHTALLAIVDEVQTSDSSGTPETYLYQWSDKPEEDISHLKTLVNAAGNLYCFQFYATDGFNAWVGTVFVRALSGEVLKASSYHIFTSGVTPYMALLSTAAMDTLQSSRYGSFTTIWRTDDFAQNQP